MDTHRHRFTLDASFWRVTILLTVISIVLCAGVALFPIDRYLPEASSSAYEIDILFRWLCALSVPIMVAVYGYIIYFGWRYRHRPDEPLDAVGSDIHDLPKLEAAWTIIPSIMMLAMGLYSYFVISSYQEAAAGAPAIEAIGHTFYFEYRYPGLKDPVIDLHLPVNKPVTMYITSAEQDERRAVIHSFWVPEFRVKQDMNPGMAVPVHFTPTRIGQFRVICTVFCGLGHAGMHGKVFVESQADFDKWYDAQKRGATALTKTVPLSTGNVAAGQKVFGNRCTTCHNAAPFDEKKVGPGLAGLFDDPKHPNLVNGKPATPANVAQILHAGYSGDMGQMPGQLANGITDADIANLVAYLETLKLGTGAR